VTLSVIVSLADFLSLIRASCRLVRSRYKLK
jgi:hypothetical protein